MLENPIRSTWLDMLWERLFTEFNFSDPLQKDSCVAMSFPSKGARGTSPRRRPCEILGGADWKGTENEKALVSIHPEHFADLPSVSRAILFEAGRVMYGKRRGASIIGVEKDGNGKLKAAPEVSKILKEIQKDLGDPPPGFAKITSNLKPEKTRLRKWVCPKCDLITRIASDTLGAELLHTPCKRNLELAD